ncbi:MULTISPECIES: cupin domain-containing protein [Brevibacillus]|jgi:oxalate decarboxylase/phosphoglucose isomerase-like protein (cupin superfamily)|uniref:Cupin domain-containing protein n=1 Tax=Brevibacillus centrosporus TaxID=54910 RepID=A0A1I4CSJ9_9BACL|nr:MULTISPECIES: cupin domain-containing protein [Brevibacillus]MDR7316957.1 oxalate decarboxylase/phosphoglucose isomerase-like protein (cupin superfamily) [Brevibacillus nitrificans]MEC2132130.1 cupin domain-containing protein [Brevibacillus centrosporus]MED1954038.1 cupin domain-containing protein [Brevibacillus centrosporus]RNB68716.1 cupin domain-containing protein [Brevibacillus centrosporus]SFK83885.1 Cupin domain-containing protein [Brevibacillus centrosporus]
MSEQNITIEEFEQKFVARLETRKLDYNALSFQEQVSPAYRRAQCRYVGTGGVATTDSNVIQAGNFTLSNMYLPVGAEGPLHLHSDVEEVFFVIKGKIVALVQLGDTVHEIPLGERDCIWSPPGYYRGVRNVGDEEAIMAVMLGAPKPQIPTYPEGSDLEAIRVERAKAKAAAAAAAEEQK